MSEIILRIRKLQSVSTTFVFFIVTISHKQRIIHGNPLQISFKKKEMENKSEKELYESTWLFTFHNNQFCAYRLRPLQELSKCLEPLARKR